MRRDPCAVETFNAFYKLEQLKRRRKEIFAANDLDVMITPTAGTVYTISEIFEKPIERNSNLGYYTDYVNLLDLSAIAIPTGNFNDGPGFGLTILGNAGDDHLIATVGHEVCAASAKTGN